MDEANTNELGYSDVYLVALLKLRIDDLCLFSLQQLPDINSTPLLSDI